MNSPIQEFYIENFETLKGKLYPKISLSYQLFGSWENFKNRGILIFHSLTGNSNVAGDSGWWSSMFEGENAIDIKKTSVLCFNVPGNGTGYFEPEILENYTDFVLRDITKIFYLGLKKLGISQVHTLAGASLGGALCWEFAVNFPKFAKLIIPIASDVRATDWILAHNRVQMQILNNSNTPLQDARMMAMMFYRTPISFKKKFNRGYNSNQKLFEVERYLYHHGDKLNKNFKLKSYEFLNHLLSSHNIARQHDSLESALSQIQSSVVVVGIDQDFFFPAFECIHIKEMLQKLRKKAIYKEIKSEHGHDAFLLEIDQMKNILKESFEFEQREGKNLALKEEEPAKKTIKVLKFGGVSLGSEDAINNVHKIIKDYSNLPNHKIVVVVSARSDATDTLEKLVKTATKQDDFIPLLDSYISTQKEGKDINFDKEHEELKILLQSVKVLGEVSKKVYDRVMSFGEKMSLKYLENTLTDIKAKYVDTSIDIIKTNSNFGNAEVISPLSEKNIQNAFEKYSKDYDVIFFSGFIASDLNNQITTLGRNGSNYTATLIANYLDASDVENWTHTSGIYTADPNIVKNAQPIEGLTFAEAHDLANNGIQVLHPKTILPLIQKNIKLRIKNTFRPKDKGTVIHGKKDELISQVKTISMLKEVALVVIEGNGMRDVIGIDSKIFQALSQVDISVKNISQTSAERSICLVIDIEDRLIAREVLGNAFSKEIEIGNVNQIYVRDTVDVLTIIGNSDLILSKGIATLYSENIKPILINNSVNSEFISLVIEQDQSQRAMNLLHTFVLG